MIQCYFQNLIYYFIEIDLKVFSKLKKTKLTIFFASAYCFKPTVSMFFLCMVKSNSYCWNWHRQKVTLQINILQKILLLLINIRTIILLLKVLKININW